MMEDSTEDTLRTTRQKDESVQEASDRHRPPLHETSHENYDEHSSALIVFSAQTVRELTAQRLPPTYIGVRRVRPSSMVVKHAMRKKTVPEEKTVPVFKIVDAETGIERRMNGEEKRKLKAKIQQAKKQKKVLEKQTQDEVMEEQLSSKSPLAAQSQRSASSTPQWQTIDGRKDGDLSHHAYLHLEINQAALEGELADLRGEREGVPPVVLAPPMARLFLAKAARTDMSSPKIVLDDELATQWSLQLKQSMLPAEILRQGEDLRPMPYQIVPEKWSRMRPPSLCPSTADKQSASEPLPNSNGVTRSRLRAEKGDHRAWSTCQIRPPSQSDQDAAAVVALLHANTNLHISCGAKFGCDYLIYDGPRNERHAFAGLRILTCRPNEEYCKSTTAHEREESPRCTCLPLPGAYELSGYVRCLNTAGKLALLATVVRDKDSCTRVAIVDLALEKTAANRGRPKKTLEKRFETLAR